MKTEASHVKHIVKFFSSIFLFLFSCVEGDSFYKKKIAKLLTWNKSCIDMKNKFALFCIHFGILINSWEWEKKIKSERCLIYYFIVTPYRWRLHMLINVCRGEKKVSEMSECAGQIIIVAY